MQALARKLTYIRAGVVPAAPTPEPLGIASPTTAEGEGFSAMEEAQPAPLLSAVQGTPYTSERLVGSPYSQGPPLPTVLPVEPLPGPGAPSLFPGEDPAVLLHYVSAGPAQASLCTSLAHHSHQAPYARARTLPRLFCLSVLHFSSHAHTHLTQSSITVHVDTLSLLSPDIH